MERRRICGLLLTGCVRAGAQLRLNKVSELIHNSMHHQDVPMSRVSVHFVEIVDKVPQTWPPIRLRAQPTRPYTAQ